MSIELHVFLQRSNLPSAKKWFDRIEQSGFNVSINADTILTTQHGFMPMQHDGCRTGFEFNIGEIEEWVTEIDDLKEAIGSRDIVANFRFSREDEARVANPAALVLAKEFGGIFYDPQDDIVLVDTTELATQLASHKPDYWLAQSPQIRIIPGREKRDAKQLKSAIGIAKKFYKEFESKITPSTVSFDLVIEGVPYAELLAFTLIALETIATTGFDGKAVSQLGRSIRAIDRIVNVIAKSERPSLLQLRDLCVRTLDLFGFEPGS